MRRQEEGEPIDSFTTSPASPLRGLAEHCKYMYRTR